MYSEISEDYILKHNEKYKIALKLNKSISNFSEDKKKEIEMKIANDMIEKNHFFITKFNFRNPNFLDIYGTYQGHSITVKILMLAIISIIGIWGIGYTVYCVSKLTTSPTGSIFSIGALFLIGFGLFLFVKK